MRTKVKTFIAVVGVMLIVTAISLIIFSRGPLYGQDAEDNWIPDMIGVWTGEGAAYGFLDVTEPYLQPWYFEGLYENGLEITHQTGRIFAGEWGSDDGGDRFKLTGVIMPDRTVSIQLFEPSEERHFITGRITRSRGSLQISGYGHFFDDFHLDGQKMMASGYGQFTKVN